jgi:hypothetical protein
MTGTARRIRSKLQACGYTMQTAAGRQLRALTPPITPALFFRALGRVVLFFCGIVVGIWLIIRFRRDRAA